MANLSDYLENKLVDHILRAATFSKPTTVYIGLFTVNPSDSGGGTEVSGGSYARIQVGPGDASWTATQGGTTGNSSGTGGQTNNAADTIFTQATANWGTVTGIGIFDAVSGGNLLFWGALTTSKTVNNGDQFKIAAGNCPITFA